MSLPPRGPEALRPCGTGLAAFASLRANRLPLFKRRIWKKRRKR
ncbi:hypothetical protein AKJ08_0746 [Vulgatibacter incomptus]|uniref:Uncharacterized protein n=1 Tax=Vulgatibacter incomptus TaxID=1391653 RepID=A0A0K1PB54_9BACT|nr:hypothetical protein AKJ08_0746 [Vulgatibacter incomptus]